MDNKRRNSTGGRPKKADPATHRYSIKLTTAEKLEFDRLFESSGLDQKAQYIKSMIFGRSLKVVKIDKATMDYYIRLTNFYYQFQAIGNNYNQTVKAVKANFGDKRGLAMLYKLEKATIELVILNRKIIALTQEFEEKYLKK